MKRSPDKWRLRRHSTNVSAGFDEKLGELLEEGALPVYIPYSERLDAIYGSWADRPRTTAASQSRWNSHDEERAKGIRALGDDLAPTEFEVVSTTFNSLDDLRTLRLVVAGYLNTREGIYGAFDYLPEPIPNKAWFEKLLTLHS